jgi:hypothetical protein
MILTGNQSFFELELLALQDNRLATDQPQSPVLELAVRSGWQRHRSVALGAALRTDELEQLVGWLRQMGQPHTQLPRLLFHDASLAFDCLTADADECLLQIKLDHDFTPAWHVNPLAPFWIPVLTTRLAVQQAADDLYTQFIQLTVSE